MRVMSHPLRFDNSGALVTIEDGSERHAAELAGVIVATGIGERGLAPEYGLSDPTANAISPDVIAAAVSRCEPELSLTNTVIEASLADASTVRLSVTWSE